MHIHVCIYIYIYIRWIHIYIFFVLFMNMHIYSGCHNNRPSGWFIIYLYIKIYLCIYMNVCIHICIHIYIERERYTYIYKCPCKQNTNLYTYVYINAEDCGRDPSSRSASAVKATARAHTAAWPTKLQDATIRRSAEERIIITGRIKMDTVLLWGGPTVIVGGSI